MKLSQVGAAEGVEFSYVASVASSALQPGEPRPSSPTRGSTRSIAVDLEMVEKLPSRSRHDRGRLPATSAGRGSVTEADDEGRTTQQEHARSCLMAPRTALHRRTHNVAGVRGCSLACICFLHVTTAYLGGFSWRFVDLEMLS